MAWEEIIEAAHPRVIAEAASNDPCLHLEIGGLAPKKFFFDFPTF